MLDGWYITEGGKTALMMWVIYFYLALSGNIYFIGSLLLHFGVIKELIVVHYATNYL